MFAQYCTRICGVSTEFGSILLEIGGEILQIDGIFGKGIEKSPNVPLTLSRTCCPVTLMTNYTPLT
jgi:hypothetical protein